MFLTRERNSCIHSTSGPFIEWEMFVLGLGAACRRLITDLMPVFCFSAAYYHFKGQTEIVDRDRQGCCDRIIFSHMTCRISTIRTSEHGIMTLHLLFTAFASFLSA